MNAKYISCLSLLLLTAYPAIGTNPKSMEKEKVPLSLKQTMAVKLPIGGTYPRNFAPYPVIYPRPFEYGLIDRGHDVYIYSTRTTHPDVCKYNLLDRAYKESLLTMKDPGKPNEQKTTIISYEKYKESFAQLPPEIQYFLKIAKLYLKKINKKLGLH